jgi:hypothetical protein
MQSFRRSEDFGKSEYPNFDKFRISGKSKTPNSENPDSWIFGFPDIWIFGFPEIPGIRIPDIHAQPSSGSRSDY